MHSSDLPELRAPAGTPLYVHLPFCAAKCHYCDFFSVAAEGHDVDAMLAAILREAEARAPREPRTVFLGGGTPSLLSEVQLARFLDRLDELTGFRAAAVEVTAECNPESLDERKAAALLALGVRRLSIGFQSLHDDVLATFGRVHTAAQSFAAFAAARAAGVEHLNVDVIYAVPGQSLESWEEDLARVLALGAEHLSAYNLTFEEGTRFRHWLEQGRMERCPEELELALFDATRRLARAHGLEPYEISNFARPGRECRHNLGYWANEPYVGLGPSAVSKIGHGRRGNLKAIAAYVRRALGGDDPVAWSEELDAPGRLGETWWLGLRRAAGVSPAEARRTSGYDLPGAGAESADPALAVARGLAAGGLLEEREGRFRLTARGLPVADAVAAEFLAEPSDATARATG